MLAPRRAPRAPVFGKRAGAAMFATSTTSCIDRSIACGRPVHNPVSAAKAASGPVCAYAVGSVQRTGARSASPVQNMFPLAAITPRSVARHADRGPEAPKGVMRTQIACGARDGSTRCTPDARGVSRTMSA
jgi:hypothetical protein